MIVSPDNTTTNEEQQREVQHEQEQLFDFEQAKIPLKRLIDEWQDECNKTKIRRATRKVSVDVEALRQQKKLDEDETLIPVRVIDTNIQREQPAYINYLKNSRRLCTFNCLTEPEIDTQNLELEFTRGMTYVGWEIPHYRAIDGAQTHGWDACEVVVDEDKPLNVAIEHIGHDNLFFPRTTINIQFAAQVIRRYKMTLLQLETSVTRYGFSAEQVQKLKDTRKDNYKAHETLDVYKRYCKKDGVVYVSWFCVADGLTDWLKSPEVLDLGLVDTTTGQPIQTTVYPIFVLAYRESEESCIVDRQGRVYYDQAKQEAQTAILSGYVNGLTRAANVFASPDKEDGTGSKLKTLEDVIAQGGRIFNNPMRFWSPPYPDPTVLQALQYFDIANSQETNQPTFAVNNRQDSRKTATEIQSANQQQQLLNSVQLTMFSTYIREMYAFVWLIVQSHAIAGRISLLRIVTQEPVVNPLDGQPVIDPMSGQVMTQPRVANNVMVLKQTFDIRAAGDVDVIQRQEKINQMMQDWPVIVNTPLRDQFLQDLVRLKYPDVGDKYAQLLAQQPQLDALKGLVGRLATILQGAAEQNPEMFQQLPPEQQADVQQTIQQSLAVAQAQ